MENKKKLLFITTRLFWPIDSGRKVSLYHYCKGLHDIYGYDIYLYSFLEPGQNESLVADKPEFIKEIRIAKNIGKFNKLSNLFFKSLLCRWPFQISLFFSKKNEREIRNICDEVQPNLVIVDMVRLAPYIKALNKLDCKKVLDLDDLLSKRYLRQCESNNSKAQILGSYASGVNSNTKNILKLSWVKNFVLKSESKRVAKAEIKYGKLYDKVIFVSDKETNEYNTKLHDKAITVRLGVDYDYFAQDVHVQKEKESFAFIGNFKVAANVDSLLLIYNEILPKLNFNYKFYVIGYMPQELKTKLKDDRIILCGRIEDARPVIKKCPLFLAPIAYGTGIKTKILEAMAMGVTVVTNSVGVEGIDGVDGVHYLVNDNSDEIANIVNNVVAGQIDVENISKSGQLLMKEKYKWENIFKSFKEII